MKPHFLAIPVLAFLWISPAIAQDAATVQVATGDEYGEYLTDASGRPLYLFTTDKSEGADQVQISCTSEECLAAWPLLTSTGDPQAGEGADASMLGTIDYEGETVVTYNGWPLYYFAKDEGADEPQGNDIESFGGEWYLVQPSGDRVESES